MSGIDARDLSASVLAELIPAQALHEADRLTEAEAGYRKVLALAPRNFVALHGLGLIALGRGELEEGLQWLRKALAADAQHADAWLNLSRAELMMGRPDAALTAADRARALRPQDAATHMARAAALTQGRTPEETLVVWEQTLQQIPEHAEAWNELGAVQRGLEQYDAALESFRRALQADPAHRLALNNFAQVLQQLHRYEDAALVYERLWQVWPDAPFAAGQMLHCKMMICDWLQFDSLCQRVQAEVDAGRTAASPFGLQGWCTSPATARRAAETFIRSSFPDRASELPPPVVHARGRDKICIGYVSGEFRHQATSILITELLELHDHSRFEVVAFDNGHDDGSLLRRRIEAAVDALVPIARLEALPAAQAVRERGIDVLVNLNGFFGHMRTDLFSLRPAPVQVNYLGFPGTMGASFMDYLIADRLVIPESSHAHYSEAIVTLPDCYQPNDRQRSVSPDLLTRRDVGLPDTGFVFCCFNNTYKLTPQVFAVWARLLKQVPGSVLWFFGWVPEAALNLAGHCRDHGIEPGRIVMAPFWPLERHLARIRLADLFLDTWPYNAHTTGSDALWAGLPVLTCTGDTFPSRVGASLLSAVGLPELITHSLADYETRALRLAREPALLAGLRQRLASNRAKAPLFDTPRLVRHIESAYEAMVARARTGQLPAPLRIGVAGTVG